MMLGISQGKLADALGITFQQVQKYERGANRVSASRLQQIAHMLQVPESFFFEGGPAVAAQSRLEGKSASPSYVSNFLASTDGLALVKAFTAIKDTKLRRKLVLLVRKIAG